MSETPYEYDQDDFPNHKVDPSRLWQEILAKATIIIAPKSIACATPTAPTFTCVITMKDELPAEQKTALDEVVAAHSGEPLESPNTPVEIKASDIVLPSQDKAFPDRSGYNVYRKGYRFIVERGNTVNYDVSYQTLLKLQGLGFRVGEYAKTCDYVDVKLVHPIYGPLVTFASTIHVWPFKEFECICPDAKDFPAGMIYRVSYTAVEPDPLLEGDDSPAGPVDVIIEHIMRTVPA